MCENEDAERRTAKAEKGKHMKKYEVSYSLSDGRRVVYGTIEEENGKFLASKGSPHRKAFNTFAYALASFELIESLQDGYITGFNVSVIA